MKFEADKVGVTEKGVESIASNLPNLISLDLSPGPNQLGTTAVGVIVKGLNKLIRLSIRNSSLMQEHSKNIGDSGIELIAAGLPQLVKLDVRECGVTDRGLESIVQGLPGLQELDICNPSIYLRAQSRDH